MKVEVGRGKKIFVGEGGRRRSILEFSQVIFCEAEGSHRVDPAQGHCCGAQEGSGDVMYRRATFHTFSCSDRNAGCR